MTVGCGAGTYLIPKGVGKGHGAKAASVVCRRAGDRATGRRGFQGHGQKGRQKPAGELPFVLDSCGILEKEGPARTGFIST